MRKIGYFLYSVGKDDKMIGIVQPSCRPSHPVIFSSPVLFGVCGFQIPQDHLVGQVPGRAIHILVAIDRPVGPIGFVVGNAVIEFGQGDIGQIFEPEFHSLVEKIFQRFEVVHWCHEDLINNRIILIVGPLREVDLMVTGDGLAGALVEPHGVIGILHAAAMTKKLNFILAFGEAIQIIGWIGRGDLNALIFELLRHNQTHAAQEGRNAGFDGERCPIWLHPLVSGLREPSFL